LKNAGNDRPGLETLLVKHFVSLCGPAAIGDAVDVLGRNGDDGDNDDDDGGDGDDEDYVATSTEGP
jgi:hypothetical protein